MDKKQANNRRKWIRLILYTLLILVFAEGVGLLWLATSVTRYAKFWDNKANKDGEITYLALGDSAAQGIGASSPMMGYVGQIANRLQTDTGKTVKIVNLSKTGAKMEDYLREQAPQIKNIKADIITIEIGANDIAGFNSKQFQYQFRQVLETLPTGSFVANMPVFNSRIGRKASAHKASKIIEDELKKHLELIFVDLQRQTSDNQSVWHFAPDFFHPNNLGYKNWADAFWQKISSS